MTPRNAPGLASLHGALKSAYLGTRGAAGDTRLRGYWWLLEQELNSWEHWVPLPPARRLWLWRHGFTSPCGALYDFDTHGASPYLSELQRYRLYRALNGNQRYLVDDKLSQHWMLADYPECRPPALGFIERGLVHGVPGTAFDGAPEPVAEWLPSVVRRHSQLVCKQVRGHGGSEVAICAYDGGFVLDGEPVTEDAMCEAVAALSGAIATEYVHQHAYADDLYPDATNTLRLLTVWDDATDSLLVPAAIQRMGTAASGTVDNWSSGGLSAPVDIDTGLIGRAAQYPYGGEVPRYATHPDTGARIEGQTVPHWSDVLETVEELAMANTHVPAIGWDVVVDESGEPVVLEANTGTDVDSLQVHGPLLADDRLAALVSRHLPEVQPPG